VPAADLLQIKTEAELHYSLGLAQTRTPQPPDLVDPANVVLNRAAKNYITDKSFDPSDLMGTDKLGIGPSKHNVDRHLQIKYHK
jgi:hypothetical protein